VHLSTVPDERITDERKERQRLPEALDVTVAICHGRTAALLFSTHLRVCRARVSQPFRRLYLDIKIFAASPKSK
jgi:hypothetical protein